MRFELLEGGLFLSSREDFIEALIPRCSVRYLRRYSSHQERTSLKRIQFERERLATTQLFLSSREDFIEAVPDDAAHRFRDVIPLIKRGLH